MKEKNKHKKKIVKYVYEAFMLIIAFVSSGGLWYWNVSPYWRDVYRGYLVLAGAGILYCFVYWFLAKMYQAPKIGLYRLTELTYFQILSFGLADVTLFVESIMWFHGFERIQIVSYIICYIIQIMTTVIMIFICNRFYAAYDQPRKILIIYGNRKPEAFIQKLESKKYRYDIRNCIKDTSSIDIIKEMIKECECIYLYEVENELKKELVLYCNIIEKKIYITQDIAELLAMGFDMSHTFDIPFIRTKKVPVQWYYPFFKRGFDIAASGLALVILFPVFLIVAVCIKFYDKGPVFYKQCRLTKDHKEFYIYKFRSMIVDAEKNGARLASQNDSRITPIGRIIRASRIDELPQLLNILKGDMSIVGPRPERPEIEKEYLKELPEFSLRLKVQAGLTGYAQVFGKYNTTPENKLKLDLLYINQQSILLDLKLILYTVKIIFIPESTEGVEEGQITASKSIKEPESMIRMTGIAAREEKQAQ